MMLRWWRCFTFQAIGKALLWIILLGGAGYAAFKTGDCPKDQTCVQEPKMKGKR